MKKGQWHGLAATAAALMMTAGSWLAGCGGGGSGTGALVVATPPAAIPAVTLVRGDVLAPNRLIRGTRANDLYRPVLGATVMAGVINDSGSGFSALHEAHATSDSLGGYTMTVPAPLSTTVMIRAGSGPYLHNLMTGTTVDLTPETTAAVNQLLAAAQAANLGLSRLRVDLVNAYLRRAVEVASAAPAGNDLATAITNAANAIRTSDTVNSALRAVIANPLPRPAATPTSRPTARPAATRTIIG